SLCCSRFPYTTLFRSQPHQLSISLIGQQVEVTIRAASHVADASQHALQQTLFFYDSFALELQAHKHLVAQRADEEIAFPARKPLAGVERHARRRDGGHPVVERLR